MCSSAYHPEDSGAERDRQPDEGHVEPGAKQPTPAEPALDPVLMESVLRETLEATAGDATDEPLSDGDMEALKAVARRHRGQPFSLDPVARELVEGIISGQFRARPDSADRWRTICSQVAETLFEDPRSHERLRSLWNRLSGN